MTDNFNSSLHVHTCVCFLCYSIFIFFTIINSLGMFKEQPVCALSEERLFALSVLFLNKCLEINALFVF